MVLVVLRILNICVLDFHVCLWSDQFEFMAFFIVLNLWIGPALILSLKVVF